jgi:hypothetical protein
MQDKYGFTVLHHAVYRGNEMAVKNMFQFYKDDINFQVCLKKYIRIRDQS